MSKIINKKITKPPSPQILKRISDNSEITYHDLMDACGYDYNNKKPISHLPKYLQDFVTNSKNIKFIKFAYIIKNNCNESITRFINKYLK